MTVESLRDEGDRPTSLTKRVGRKDTSHPSTHSLQSPLPISLPNEFVCYVHAAVQQDLALHRTGCVVANAPQILPIDAIKIIQKEYGIKNKQAFAESIGVSRQYISKICNE